MNQQQRRRFLAQASSLAALSSRWAAPAALGASALAGTVASAPAEMTIDAGRVLRPVNPLILGNNIDWTHSAQGMIPENSDHFDAGYLALADRLAPTALRYPGGTNSDFYRWRNGIGPIAGRKPTKTLEGKEEVIKLGTDEFLGLCKRWGCEPIITVNIATGSAEEAADWVRYTNKRGTDLPRVKYWEIGNEQYLEAHFPEAKMTPAEYARRANAYIVAMKAVDPTIECGLVLRNDTLGGVEATPYKGYNDIVLKGVTAPFEFAALHSSYFPVTFEKKETPEELYLATMAGTRVMQEDIEATRAKLALHHPGRKVKLAFTEYNALYSLDILRWGLASVFLSKTDRYIESMAAALYVADALRVYSQTSDLLMANFWSIAGNWWYGAISHEGKPRPQYHVLEAYKELARGELLHTLVRSPTMETPRAGFVPAMRDVPQVEAHAVSREGVLRVAAINKNPSTATLLRILVPAVDRAQVTVRELGADGIFERQVRLRDSATELRGGRVELSLPKHSFSVITLRPR
ncbi:alpha-N-arabinofuranosidase [Burkholderiaceae bacterium]|nr:alpha-N-arabinofuranosidase [Burkholderiaceae bacterium]